MKITHVQVSDHALIRFMERVYKIDLEPVKTEIARRCWDAGMAGASTFTLDGVTFCFGKGFRDGSIWVSTVLTTDMRSKGKGKKKNGKHFTDELTEPSVTLSGDSAPIVAEVGTGT